MTELATRDNNSGGLAFAPTPNQLSLIEWVETAKAVQQIAVGLVQTAFCPPAYRGKPQEATAAILAGYEVGLNPIASLRAFDNIQGQAAAKAATLRAIVQSKGHKIWLGEQSETRVVAYGRRLGDDETHESEWTIERAKKLKLHTKENWQNQPKAMLIARATAEVCRMTASDAIMGMPYSAEELADHPEPVKVTATRRPAPKTIREALGVEPGPVMDHTAAAPGSALDKERRWLFAVLGKLGLTGEAKRDDRLAVLSALTRRPITSSDELTAEEVETVVGTLDAVAQQPDEQERALTVAELVTDGRTIRAAAATSERTD